jgi:hypothetical protein
MSVPGFTAEASDYCGGGYYRTSRYYVLEYQGRVAPATNWGDIGDRGCLGVGIRGYSAILWNIPWGKSWEDACAETPGPDETPVAGRLPDRCINTGNMWGEWDVPDVGCAANWGSLSNGCNCGIGVGWRTYSATLWNIPPVQPWDEACRSTPAPPGTDVAGRLPNRCKNSWGHMWGEWDVRDRGCCCSQCVACWVDEVMCDQSGCWDTSHADPCCEMQTICA